jgi:hypothetical protein
MNVTRYIESGVLETYLLGLASEEEVQELTHMKRQYPEVQKAMSDLESDMERIAAQMAISPPPGTWEKIENRIDDLIIAPAIQHRENGRSSRANDYEHHNGKSENFIEVEAETLYMRVHKTWKWVFAAVFVLGKIFLACAIYFYLENRQAQQQVKELKSELSQKLFVNP